MNKYTLISIMFSVIAIFLTHIYGPFTLVLDPIVPIFLILAVIFMFVGIYVVIKNWEKY